MYINFPKADDVVSLRSDQVKFPRIRRIRQLYNSQRIDNLHAHMQMKFTQLNTNKDWYSGKRIAITVGSRGIPHVSLIVRCIVNQLRDWGAIPFIVPAMGSHGGGTVDGQLAILSENGITEEIVGAPIVSSMEVVQYGTLSNGISLYCDKNAAMADGIVLFNKVKPHTDFRGVHESGIAKMIAIGISKFQGCSAFHSQGFSHFAESIPVAANLFFENFKVCFSVGVVQNAYDDICAIEIANSNESLKMDSELLVLARERMATFKFSHLDLLIIDQIGKEISGYGQDPNVTGRANGREKYGFDNVLSLNKMVILGLTKKTHHNGVGIAEADVTTRRCLNSIDWGQTWTNLVASTEIRGAKIPLYRENDKEAIKFAMAACGVISPDRFLLARIRNTLALGEIEVSEGLYQQIKDRKDVQAISEMYELEFDSHGFLKELGYVD